ncbi:MAG: hypothetical protein QOH52_4527, partial [Pseudonocardiales bacterium]|nr:hypothetical protein [Pseudonocardiales bacterium]
FRLSGKLPESGNERGEIRLSTDSAFRKTPNQT